MLVENYKVRLMVQLWQEYSRQAGYDSKRQNSKGQNKQKEEISYAQMELTQQEENSMIHVPYPYNQLVHHYIPFQIGDTDTSNA